MVAALIVIAVILLFIALLLVMPVTFCIFFKDKFTFKIKLYGITVFNSDKPRKNKAKSDEEKHEELQKEENKSNFFKNLKEKKGFSGAIKECCKFVSDVLKRVKKLLHYVHIKNLILNIVIASDDAAVTAIEYGAVCTAVYPVISFLTAFANIKSKKINISSDFNVTNPDIDFYVDIKLRMIFAVILMLEIFSEYKKFNSIRNENDE